jgi:hypothetical protein
MLTTNRINVIKRIVCLYSDVAHIFHVKYLLLFQVITTYVKSTVTIFQETLEIFILYFLQIRTFFGYIKFTVHLTTIIA